MKYYTTYAQLLASLDAEPVLWAKFTLAGTDYYVAVDSLAIEDADTFITIDIWETDFEDYTLGNATGQNPEPLTNAWVNLPAGGYYNGSAKIIDPSLGKGQCLSVDDTTWPALFYIGSRRNFGAQVLSEGDVLYFEFYYRRDAYGSNTITIKDSGLNSIITLDSPNVGSPYPATFTFSWIGTETKTSTLDVDKWYLVKVGYKGDTFDCYLDGVKVYSDVTCTSANLSWLYFESQAVGGGYSYLDDLHIWRDIRALTAIFGDALSFGTLSEALAPGPEASTIQVVLDGVTFDTSMIGATVALYLGATRLTSDEHEALWSGEVIAENRNRYRLNLSCADTPYQKLSRTYLPKWRIRDEYEAVGGTITAPPTEQIDTPVPLVFGTLSSSAQGGVGRLRCIPITAVEGGTNSWLICQTDAGVDAYSVTGAWQNGTPISSPSITEQAGAAFDYLFITIAASDYRDEVWVDLTHRTSLPIDELYAFLNDAGFCDIAAGSLDLASFNAAQDVCDARSYLLGGAILQPTQATQIVSDWLASFACEMLNAGGVFGVRCRDYDLDYAATDYTEDSHMQWGSLQINADVNEVVNAVNYTAIFDGAGAPLVTGCETQAASITTYGRRERSISLPWAGSAATAKDVAQRLAYDYKSPRQRISFTTYLRGMAVEVLDQIRVTAENLFRTYSEVRRRALNGDSYQVAIECLDVDDLYQSGFHLGADEARSSDARNCAVTNSTDESGATLSLDEGGDTVTGTGTDFKTKGVKVGDFLTCWKVSGGAVAVNMAVYEIVEAGKVIGDTVGSETVLQVVNPNDDSAVTFAAAAGGGDETITVWWIARSWATATDEQKRQGYLTDTDGEYSDGTEGKKLI